VQEDGAGRKTPADTAACYMLEALNAAASPTLYSLLAVACHTPVVRVRLRLEEGDAMMGRGDGTVEGIRGRPLHSLLVAAACGYGPPEQTWRDTTFRRVREPDGPRRHMPVAASAPPIKQLQPLLSCWPPPAPVH